RISKILLTFICALAISMLCLQGSKSQAQSSPATSAKVDLNSASESELNALPGIGPATSKKIVAGRPYSSVADLRRAGVSQKTIEKITPLVTVSSATSAAPAPPASKEAQSRARAADSATVAPSGKVWVNLDTKVYHREGDRWYG